MTSWETRNRLSRPPLTSPVKSRGRKKWQMAILQFKVKLYTQGENVQVIGQWVYNAQELVIHSPGGGRAPGQCVPVTWNVLCTHWPPPRVTKPQISNQLVNQEQCYNPRSARVAGLCTKSFHTSPLANESAAKSLKNVPNSEINNFQSNPNQDSSKSQRSKLNSTVIQQGRPCCTVTGATCSTNRLPQAAKNFNRNFVTFRQTSE